MLFLYCISVFDRNCTSAVYTYILPSPLSATVAQPVEHQNQNLRLVSSIPNWENVFLHMFVPISTHAVGMELSSLCFGRRQLQ